MLHRNAILPRRFCFRCRRPERVCYCAELRPFPSWPRLAVLMHPEEKRRAIASGRMAHLMISNSKLFVGCNFTDDPQVNQLLADPGLFPMLLYPGRGAINLSTLSPADRSALIPQGRTPLVFVPDGTWRTAKRIRRLSENLHSLPELTFTVPAPSRFLVRKQPEEHCLSTIEAIHHLLELFGDSRPELLAPFDFMVELQIRKGVRR